MTEEGTWSNQKWASLLRQGKGRLAGSIVLLLCLVLFGLNLEKGLFPELRLSLFDAYQKTQPRIRETAPVTIVAIDEESLQRFGQWPWPRDLVAHLLTNIAELGPVSMGMDVIFAEPDRLSPDQIILQGDIPKNVRDWFSSQTGNDTILGNVISQVPLAMGMAGLEEGNLSSKSPLPAAQENGFKAGPWLRNYNAELRSLPVHIEKAWGHGLLSVDPDPDGIVRRIPLAASLGKRIAPSLDLEVLRLAVGANWFTLNGSSSGVKSLSVGDLNIPTQKDATVWIHYTPHDPTRFVSASRILDKMVDPAMITNKLVLIGVTGLGLVDYPATPVAARMPGVEVRAQLIENIFDQKLLKRPDWAGASELGLLALIGGLAIWAVPKLSPKASPILWLGVTVACVGIGFGGYSEGLVLIDTANPGLGGSLVFVTMLAAVLVETDHQNKLYKRDLEIQREREAKMAGELDAAKRIQMGILPDTSLIKDPRLDICAFLEPARDIGGDLYDVFKVDEDHLFFLVGDVAGKGIPASLFMALGKSLYKSSVLRRQTDIAVIMSEANAEISRDNPEMLFITAFAGILNLNTGELQYCNAGHDAPHLFMQQGDVEKLEGVGGPPLCVLDDMEYPGETTTLKPGQSILIITDGVTEAMNNTNELYTAERLDVYVENITIETSADDMVQGLYRDVKTHAEGAEPSDDITILALTWRGKPDEWDT